MVGRTHGGAASGAAPFQSACLQKQLLCFIINTVSYELLCREPCTNNNNEEEVGGRAALPKQWDKQVWEQNLSQWLSIPFWFNYSLNSFRIHPCPFGLSHPLIAMCFCF